MGEVAADPWLGGIWIGLTTGAATGGAGVWGGSGPLGGPPRAWGGTSGGGAGRGRERADVFSTGSVGVLGVQAPACRQRDWLHIPTCVVVGVGPQLALADRAAHRQ